MRISTPLFLSVSILLTLSAEAQEIGNQRDFGFRPLEIYKFKNGSSRLIVDDLNRDGLDDILFANNHVSRLEILLRKPETKVLEELPELEDRFEDKGIIVDQNLKAVRVGDLNQDSLKDIVTFGTTLGLQVRYQQQDGSFASPERIFIKDPDEVTTIQLKDLNGDGLSDILVSRKNQATLLWNSTDHPFRKKKTLTFATEKSYFGDIADINTDGIPDLAFHFNSNRNPLKIRYGKGGGLFGSEKSLDLPPRQYMDILQAEGFAPRIGMVLRNRLAIRTYRFGEKEQSGLIEAQESSPARIGLEGTSKKSSPAWLVGDFNTDGFDDLLIAAPELSRLHLYSGSAEGLDPEPKCINTLSEVSRLSRTIDGDILVVSKKEKIAARHSSENIEQFPAILDVPGDVLAGCAEEAGSNSWFICKNDEKELQLIQIQPHEKSTVYPLDLKNDPIDLLVFQLPENRIGFIFFMAYDTPKMKILTETKLEDLTSESFRALTQRLTLSNLLLESPGDGSILTVAQGAIARRFEWRGDRYEVTRQFNPENPRGELIASCRYELLNGNTGTFFYDRNSGDLIRFSDEDDEADKIHLPDANQTIYNLVQLRNSERDTLVLLDRTGLNEVIGHGTRPEAVSEGEYISPAKDPLLAYVKLVKLGSPPRPMIAVCDPANRAIEIVAPGESTLENQLSFEVFLTSDFADSGKPRGTEPHDLESGDLNGDGIGDLVALVHDNLLIYLGE